MFHAEAETLQQRAERKRGREAVSAYEQAASGFRRALDLEQRSPLPFERHCDAYFGLAEVLQNWAEAVLAVCRTLPDADLTRDVEQQASNAAQPLFRQSVEAYQQVRTGMQEMRADAAVNSGNALAAWAELLPAGEAVQMLASAQKSYEAALTQEEDAATWGNRADALVRQAELLAEVTPAQVGGDAVGQAFAQAMQAYEKACSMTSSEQGDDLPGLLHNWGVGLRSMADLQKDAEAACNIYALAVQKLQASIQFVRGDVAPHNAVGDAHVSWAEHLPDSNAMQHLHLALDQGIKVLCTSVHPAVRRCLALERCTAKWASCVCKISRTMQIYTSRKVHKLTNVPCSFLPPWVAFKIGVKPDTTTHVCFVCANGMMKA
ncbi:TPA: hypothetical protein ACH3X1_004592 [Trebouxia sp. C0004]